MKELMELYEGKKPAAPVAAPAKSMDELVDKFLKQGGEIVGEVTKGEAVGKVGAHNKGQHNQAILVFYPDGTFKRFDKDAKVEYKDGWKGPEIDSDNLKGPKRELSDYERRTKEFEKKKKEYARKAAKARKENERIAAKNEKKFGREAEKAAKWLSAVDLDDPKNSDVKKFLQRKGGVVDAMGITYQVIIDDNPGFALENLDMKLKTVLDLDYLEKFGGITKTEKKEFMMLPMKFQRWAAASVLL